MATSFQTPTRQWGRELFSRSQQVRELFELALATQLRPLRPVVVVHRVEGQHHPHTVLDLAELDHRLDLVGLDARNEIGDVLVDETARRAALLDHHPLHRRERPPPLRPVLHPLGSRGRHPPPRRATRPPFPPLPPAPQPSPSPPRPPPSP